MYFTFRKRRVQRSPQLQAVPVVVLDLDAEDSPTKGQCLASNYAYFLGGLLSCVFGFS